MYICSSSPRAKGQLKAASLPCNKENGNLLVDPNKGRAAYFYSHSRHIMDKIKMPVSCPEIRRHKSLRNKSREEKAETKKKAIRAWVP